MRRNRTEPGKASQKSAWANAESWLRRRRANVQAAVAKGAPENPVNQEQVQRLASQLWSQRHEKEKALTKDREWKRRFLDGTFHFFFERFQLVP